MTITMYDSVDLSMIPGDAQAVGAYVDGKWATYTAAKAKFPKADILSIAVFAADDADCLDIETGDATPVQAAAWVLRQFARKVAFGVTKGPAPPAATRSFTPPWMIATLHLLATMSVEMRAAIWVVVFPPVPWFW